MQKCSCLYQIIMDNDNGIGVNNENKLYTQNYCLLFCFETKDQSEIRDMSNTVESRYLEFQGTHWNTSRYPYLDISELREWGKQ